MFRVIISTLIILFFPFSLVAKDYSGAPKEFSRWIIDQMHQYNVESIVVGKVQDYKIDWIDGFGYANRERSIYANHDSVFQVPQFAQAVTTILLLQELQTKEIPLDDSINKYLKSWQIPANKFNKNITFRMLLENKTGIDFVNIEGVSVNTRLPQTLDFLSNLEIKFFNAPGAEYRYTPISYIIMQIFLEDSAGENIADLAKKKVFSRSGMSSASLGLPAGKYWAKAAKPYLYLLKNLPGGAKIYPSLGSHGMWASVEDLAKFVVDFKKTIDGKDNVFQLDKELIKTLFEKAKDNQKVIGFDTNINNQLGKVEDDWFYGIWAYTEGYIGAILLSEDKGDAIIVVSNSYDKSKDDFELNSQYDFIRKTIWKLAFFAKWINKDNNF